MVLHKVCQYLSSTSKSHSVYIVLQPTEAIGQTVLSSSETTGSLMEPSAHGHHRLVIARGHSPAQLSNWIGIQGYVLKMDVELERRMETPYSTIPAQGLCIIAALACAQLLSTM